MRQEDFRPDDVRLLLAREQRDLVLLLRTLSEAEWETPSLCAGWRVRDVVGHLVGTTLPMHSYLSAAIRQRSADKLNARMVAQSASVPVPTLLELMEASIGTGWAAALLPSVMLGDTLVHHQDIRRPLGKLRAIPRDRLLTVLTYPDPFTRPGRRMHGLRFVATDVRWTTGVGPEVRGTGEALALAIAGRPAVLDELSGDGVLQLRARLAS